MATLWQKLTKKKEEKVVIPDVETKFYNPLDLRINNPVKVNTLDLSDKNFNLRRIREVTRTIGDREFVFVDYDILHRPLGNEEEVKLRLRLIPMEDPDADLTHDAILMTLVAEFPYNEEYETSLNYENNSGTAAEPIFDENNEPAIDENGEPKFDIFYRVNDVEQEWDASVATLSDEDNNGKVDEDEVRRSEMKYWDFWRETEKDGSQIIEFYIVEEDENGYFEIWRGTKVDSNRIEI